MAQRVPSRQTFRQVAEPVRVEIGGNRFLALPKLFKTGSMGFYHSGKITLDLSGEPLTYQVSLSIVMVGSKDAPALDGMTSSERLAEQEAWKARQDSTLASPLYPVADSDENVRIDSKASGMPQDAFGTSQAIPAPLPGPAASSEAPGSPKTQRARRKGGAK